MSQLNQIVADCLTDKILQDRFLSNPQKVLDEMGFQLPEGVNLTVVVSTDKDIHLVIPDPDVAQNLETSVADDSYKRLVIRALKEPDYYQKVFSNPKKCLEEAYQVTLGDDVTVHPHQMDKDHWVLVFPQRNQEANNAS